MKRQQSRVLVAALALTLLASCSSDKDTGGSAGSDSTMPVKSSAPTSTADPAKNGASEIGIDQPDPSKAMFSKQFALPSDPRHKVTVGILSLERKDRVAILKVAVTPEFADLPASELIGFRKSLDESDAFAWQPTLLDLKNLKKYKVLHSPGMDGSGMLVFARGENVSGQPIYAWAVFAAPSADVTNIDVTIAEWMPRFTNVPVT